VQKLLYIILLMRLKLLHYFESHLVCMVTSQKLREIIRNHVTTGNIANWSLELKGLDIAYVPQTTIKSHALTDFVVE
jgi:hypothetical protein